MQAPGELTVQDVPEPTCGDEQARCPPLAGWLDPTIWVELDEAYPLDAIGDALEAARSRRRIKPLVRLGHEST